jgi:hypothetical protein
MSLLSWNRGGVEKARGSEVPLALDEPDLSREGIEPTRPQRGAASEARWRLLESCANPFCVSGWLHLWRSRSTPVFEGGWNCSAECTRARLQAAVRREMSNRGAPASLRPHRIPLGLVMLEQGWIAPAQLRQALEAQKAARRGRIGEWLMRRCGVSEELVTRALGLQWSCPVLAIDRRPTTGPAALLPRLFADAFGALPLRVAADRILYLGFEERPDAALAFAVGRMTGLRVETGLVPGSTFRTAHQRLLAAEFPAVELVEAVSEGALAQAFARAVEQAQPAESRLVRVHDCVWLRMWLRRAAGAVPQNSAVRDMIGMLGLEGGPRRS